MRNGKYIEDENECWYLNGKLHRTDGPAVIRSDGCQKWYLNGNLHRTDGPAVTWSNGSQKWYLNGEKVDKDTFNLLLTCTIEDLGEYFFSSKYKDYKSLIEDRLRRNRV